MQYPIRLGCTHARHRRLGVHAVVNARSGQQFLNDGLPIELVRDADRLRGVLAIRLRVYQWESRWFRRRFSHLLAHHDD